MKQHEIHGTIENDRAVMRDVLTLCCVRTVLVRLAETIARVESHEADAILDMLESQINDLQARKLDFLPWRQATQSLDGPAAYGLQRIGLWPEKDSSNENP